MEPRGYVTSIGMSLIQPLLTLVEQLTAWEVALPNDVQTSEREKGYAAAIIVLAVTLLESAFNRTAYVRQDPARRDPAEYFQQVSAAHRFPDTIAKKIAEALNEVYSVRDIIVHNHMWEAETMWPVDGSPPYFANVPTLLSGYGDKRFQRIREGNSLFSRQLRLNLLPSRIFRRDALMVLKTVWHVLQALESMDRRYWPISGKPFAFGEPPQLLTFPEILAALDMLWSFDTGDSQG